jgi:hypothetical protein
MSHQHAWQVLGIRPIPKVSACTNHDKDGQAKRRLNMFHWAMDPIIAEINKLCKTSKDYHWADKLVQRGQEPSLGLAGHVKP